jgi:TonB family protein
MNVLAQSPLLMHLGWSLIHFLWQAALVGFVYFCLRRVLQRAPPQWRYVLALSTLLVLVLLPVLTFFYLGGWRAPNLASNSAPAVYSLVAAPLTASTLPPAALHARTLSYLSWVVLVWLMGVACMAVRASWGWRQAGKLRLLPASFVHPWQPLLDALQQRMRVQRMVQLLESARVHAPLVIGWLKPVILIPPSTACGLSWQQAEMILAHELAHIRRHDYLFNLLQVAAETLLFYHPVVHWISRDARTEREFCCDDAAMQICDDRVAYLKALAKLEQRRQHALPALAATGGSLLNRAYRLAYRIEPIGKLPAWPATLVLLVGLLAAAVLIRPQHATRQPAPIRVATALPVAAKITQSAIPQQKPATQGVTPSNTAPSPPTRLVPQVARLSLAQPLNVAEPGPLPVAVRQLQLAAITPPANPAAALITVVAPHPLPEPEYPYAALRDGRGGAVQVAFRVNQSGRAADIQTTILSGPVSLASATRAALQNWQFNPVRVNGHSLTPHVSFTLVFTPDPEGDSGGRCPLVTGSQICHRYQISLQNASPQKADSAVADTAQLNEDLPVKLAVVENARGPICRPQDPCFFTASQPPPGHEQQIKDQLRLLSQGFAGGGSL